MRSLLTRSLFARILAGVLALVLAAILLVSAAAIFLLPPTVRDPSVDAVFFALAVLILAAVAVDVYFLARNISEPLSQLAQATRAIAQGNLEAPLTVSRDDEIGRLAEDFRAMQKELVESRRALEAEKERYAELNDLKERLLGNLPHEIMTPLSAIAASLEILQEHTGELSVESRVRLLGSIHRSVARLQYLLKNMLDASSIQAGQFRIRLEPVLLGPILEEARLFIEPLLEQNEQTLQIENAADDSLVNVDPMRIMQVLVNLLSNAGKYGEPASTIQVRTMRQDDRVCISVQNRGTTIPTEEQHRVFERFARHTSNNEVAGVGLGLAIARTIVEMHGGEIGLTSDAEKGTTVWFTVALASNNVTVESRSGELERPKV